MNSPETSQQIISEEVHDSKGLETCLTELQQQKERNAYLMADFENYRRQVEKDRVTWMTSAQNGVLVDMIAIIDDFERARKDMQDTGIELIYKACLKLLAKYGIEEITENTVFDPYLHEAIVQVPVEGKESGAIVEVIQKGYRRKGVILRPAKVSVAQ